MASQNPDYVEPLPPLPPGGVVDDGSMLNVSAQAGAQRAASSTNNAELLEQALNAPDQKPPVPQAPAEPALPPPQLGADNGFEGPAKLPPPQDEAHNPFMQPEPTVLGEAWKGVKHAPIGLEKGFGGALDYAGKAFKSGGFQQLGQFLLSDAASREDLTNTPDASAGFIKGAAGGMGEGLHQLAMTTGAGALIGGAMAGPPGAVVGGVIGTAVALPAFFGMAAHEGYKLNYDAAIKAGKTPDEANDIGLKAGGADGTIMAGAQALLSALPLGKLASPVLEAAGGAVKGALVESMLSTGWRKIGTQVVTHAGEMGGVMAGQDAAIQGVDISYGGRDSFDPMETAQAGATGLGMGLVTGSIGAARSARHANQTAGLLADPSADQNARGQAAFGIAAVLKARDPELAKNFLQYSGMQILNGKPVEIMPDKAYARAAFDAVMKSDVPLLPAPAMSTAPNVSGVLDIVDQKKSLDDSIASAEDFVNTGMKGTQDQIDAANASLDTARAAYAAEAEQAKAAMDQQAAQAQQQGEGAPVEGAPVAPVEGAQAAPVDAVQGEAAPVGQEATVAPATPAETVAPAAPLAPPSPTAQADAQRTGAIMQSNPRNVTTSQLATIAEHHSDSAVRAQAADLLAQRKNGQAFASPDAKGRVVSWLADQENGQTVTRVTRQMPDGSFEKTSAYADGTSKVEQVPAAEFSAKRAEPAMGEAPAKPDTVDTVDTSAAAVRAKLKSDPAFKAAWKENNEPHPESGVAGQLLRGWLDAEAGKPMDRAQVSPITPDMKPDGLNPVDSYQGGYLSKSKGKPFQVRAMDRSVQDENGKWISPEASIDKAVAEGRDTVTEHKEADGTWWELSGGEGTPRGFNNAHDAAYAREAIERAKGKPSAEATQAQGALDTGAKHAEPAVKAEPIGEKPAEPVVQAEPIGEKTAEPAVKAEPVVQAEPIAAKPAEPVAETPKSDVHPELVDLKGALDREAQANGQTAAPHIVLVDPATLPDKPVAVNNGVKNATTLSKARYKLVQKVAAMFGQKVVLFRAGDAARAGELDDGMVLSHDGKTVYLNADASGADHMVIVGHEIAHQMKKNAPALYRQLGDALRTQFKGDAARRFYRYYNAIPEGQGQRSTSRDVTTGKGKKKQTTNVWTETKEPGRSDASIDRALQNEKTHDRMVGEFIADLFGNRFAESRTWTKMFRDLGGNENTNKGLVYRIADFITSFIDRLMEHAPFRKFATDGMVRDLKSVQTNVRQALKEYAQMNNSSGLAHDADQMRARMENKRARADKAEGFNGTKEPMEQYLVSAKGVPFVMRRAFRGKYEMFIGDQKIGSVSYHATPMGEWKASGVEVDPKYRRQGIASAAYDFLEKKVINDKFTQLGGQSEDGRAFREGRDQNKADAEAFNRSNAAKERDARESQVDPANDDLRTAISKLGGLNKADVKSQWGSDSDAQHGRRWLVSPNGLSIEAMSQKLHELGYLHDTENLHNELATKFESGKSHYTPEGEENQARLAWEDHQESEKERAAIQDEGSAPVDETPEDDSIPFSKRRGDVLASKPRASAEPEDAAGRGRVKMRGPGDKPSIYGGESAASIRPERLEGAKARIAAGDDPEAVRKETGWFKSRVDDKWRHEIDDSRAKLTKPWDQVEEEGYPSKIHKMSDVLDHPELYHAYPEARDIPVTKKGANYDWFGNTQGWFNPENGRLNVTPYAKDPLSVMLHELQHWVQGKEGFDSGGNVESSRLDNSVNLAKLESRLHDRIAALGDATDVKSGFQGTQLENLAKSLGKLREQMPENREAYKRMDAADAHLAELEQQKKAVSAKYDQKQADAKVEYAAYEKARDAYRKEKLRLKLDTIVSSATDAHRKAYEDFIAQGEPKEVPWPGRDWSGEAAENDAIGKQVNAERDAKKEAEKSVGQGIAGLNDLKHGLYQLIAGEREARDTQARQGMDVFARRDTAPYSAESIRDSQVIRSQGDISASTRRGEQDPEVTRQIKRLRGQLETAEDRGYDPGFFASKIDDLIEADQLVSRIPRSKWDAEQERFYKASAAAGNDVDRGIYHAAAEELGRRIAATRTAADIPRDLVHGTTKEGAEAIRKAGGFKPGDGTRAYSYSELGPDASYFTVDGGHWLNVELGDRKAIYDAKLHARLSPDANIVHIRNDADVRALAKKLGYHGEDAEYDLGRDFFVDGFHDGPESKAQMEKLYAPLRAKLKAAGIDGIYVDKHYTPDAGYNGPSIGGHFASDQVAVFNHDKIALKGDAPGISASKRRSEAFNDWFGESKVTDEEGNPKTVYHGTSKGGFDQFDAYGSNHGLFGQGVYTTESRDVAQNYTKKGRGSEPQVYPLHARIEHPIDMDARADRAAWEKGFPAVDFDSYAPHSATNEGFYRAAEDHFIDEGLPKWEGAEAMQEGLRGMGHDGITHMGGGRVDAEGERHRVHIAFDPEQVKSATENSGEFNREDANIYASKRRAQGLGELTKDQETELEKVGGIISKPGIKQRVASKLDGLGLRLEQNIAHRYAPIRAISELGFKQARQARGSDGGLEAIMQYGKLSVDKDGAYDTKIDEKNPYAKGFAAALAKLDGEHNRFFWWIAAHRAEDLAKLSLENNFDKDSIRVLKGLDKPNADGTAADRPQKFQEALKAYNDFNDNVLAIAEKSGLINAATRAMFKLHMYVPFFRVAEETGDIAGPRNVSGLVNQFAFHKLGGGTDKLNSDLLANVLQNWSHLLGASARNRAARTTLDAAQGLGAAHKIPSGLAGKNSVKVMVNGEKQHWTVTNKPLYGAVSAMYAEVPKWMKPLSTFKHALTFGVTVMPGFKYRNVIRDTITTAGISEASNPFKTLVEGWEGTNHGSQTRASMLASGAIIRFGNLAKEGSAQATHRLIRTMIDPKTVLDSPGKLKQVGDKLAKAFDAYQELGDRSENINRAGLYKQLRAKGFSHMDASFAARDLLDFSDGGTHAAIQFLVQSVPFMNARIQGLFKLGQAAMDPKTRKQFLVTAGAVSLASLALMLRYQNDPDYKRREDWERDNFWWFKFGGVGYSIPKPFEIGAIGTAAERLWQTMDSSNHEMTAGRLSNNLLSLLGSQFSLNPTPQIVKPFKDIYANRDSFTDRPIESMAMQKLQPEDRYDPRSTSAIARGLGKLPLPDPTQLLQNHWQRLSPVQYDALLKGYFGGLGQMIIDVADHALKPSLGMPAARPWDLGNYTMGIAQSLPANRSSRYMTDLYDQMREVEQAHNSWKQAMATGDYAKARQELQDNRQLITQYSMLEAAKRMESRMNLQEKRVANSLTMTASQKQDRMQMLNEQRNKIAERMMSNVRRRSQQQPQ
jgi:hypothetical protein